MEPKSLDSPRQSGEHETRKASSPLIENDAPSTLAKEGDQGGIPHATASAIQVAEDVARGVKTAVGETVPWTEAKVSKLSAKEEDGTGPYGTLATDVPSDLDPIATGVLLTMYSSGKALGGDSSDSEQDQVKGVSDSGSKYGKDE